VVPPVWSAEHVLGSKGLKGIVEVRLLVVVDWAHGRWVVDGDLIRGQANNGAILLVQVVDVSSAVQGNGFVQKREFGEPGDEGTRNVFQCPRLVEDIDDACYYPDEGEYDGR